MKKTLLSAMLGLSTIAGAQADCEYLRTGVETELYKGSWGEVRAELIEREDEKIKVKLNSRFIDGTREETLHELILGKDNRVQHHAGLPLILEDTFPVKICSGPLITGEDFTREYISEVFDTYIRDVEAALREGGEISREGNNYVLIPEDNVEGEIPSSCIMRFGKDLLDIRHSPTGIEAGKIIDWIRIRPMQGKLTVQYRRAAPIGAYMRNGKEILPESDIIEKLYEKAKTLHDKKQLPSMRAYSP